MNVKYEYITGPFVAVVFLTLSLEFVYYGPVYCWMACLQPEISCLATTSYTFGLVPATTLAGSSAISGCLASFDVCELSCAKRSDLRPFSMTNDISNSCEIFRNGTKIKPAEIKNNPWLANPFHLDADCHPLPNTTVAPPTTTPLPFTPLLKIIHPHAKSEFDSETAEPIPDAKNDFKHPIIVDAKPSPQ